MNNQLSCVEKCSEFLPEVNNVIKGLSPQDTISLDKHLKISGLSRNCYLCVIIGLKKMKMNDLMKRAGVSESEFYHTINRAVDPKNPEFLLSAIENFENLGKNGKGGFEY